VAAFALISGTIFRAPERKVSRAGKPFATATVKCRDGDAFVFWRLTVFSESCQEELLRLTEGDAVACQGAMRAELYTPEGGQPRVSLSLVADAILPAKGRTKRKDNPESDRQVRAGQPAEWRARGSLAEQAANGGSAVSYGHEPRHWGGSGTDEIGDDIPF
jgi:single-stranded DNA-binding protein